MQLQLGGEPLEQVAHVKVLKLFQGIEIVWMSSTTNVKYLISLFTTPAHLGVLISVLGYVIVGGTNGAAAPRGHTLGWIVELI